MIVIETDDDDDIGKEEIYRIVVDKEIKNLDVRTLFQGLHPESGKFIDHLTRVDNRVGR